MAIDSETARENARAAAAKTPAVKPTVVTKPTTTTKPTTSNIAKNTVPTGSSYGAFAESPLYQYNPLIQDQSGGGKSNTNTGPTVTNTFYSGTGSNRMKVEVLSDGTTRQTPAPEATLNTGSANRTSAYEDLLSTFSQYGLGALVEPLKGLITDSTSNSELTLKLRQTPAYQKRFAANADRIAKGLTALSEGEYLALEDQYQNIMRNYGLPDTYWKKGDLGRQEGFEKFIAGDVSPTELEDRISTAQNRVVNANPQVKEALKKFYPDITDADILAYALDPKTALTDIKRKVTAAEIGGAALGQGLSTSQLDAEGLAGYGITKQQAEAGYGTIAEMLPTAQKLAGIYQEQPYTQQQAEQEIFNLAGSAEASKKRKKLAAAEQAAFSGSSGIASGALSRDRALNSQSYGSPGAY